MYKSSHSKLLSHTPTTTENITQTLARCPCFWSAVTVFPTEEPAGAPTDLTRANRGSCCWTDWRWARPKRRWGPPPPPSPPPGARWLAAWGAPLARGCRGPAPPLAPGRCGLQTGWTGPDCPCSSAGRRPRSPRSPAWPACGGARCSGHSHTPRSRSPGAARWSPATPKSFLLGEVIKE